MSDLSPLYCGLCCSIYSRTKCLNHQPRNLKGVARIYNRYAYAKEKEAAWKLWSNHVASLAKGRRDE
jgi:hypothetical protein